MFVCAGTFEGVDVGNITIALVYGMHAPFRNPPVSLYRGLTSCCVSTPSARTSNVCITTNAPLHECVSLGMYVYKCMLVCVHGGRGRVLSRPKALHLLFMTHLSGNLNAILHTTVCGDII